MSSETIVAVSAAMREALARVHRFGPTSLPILLLGPTGAGKELLAQEVHRVSRRHGALIDVNCAALPKDLVEGELFGHRRGAFTGAATDTVGLVASADRGTLFLDELGSLPFEAQGKLLRVLDNHEVRKVGESFKRAVDFRLVCATHEDLLGESAAGRFRVDLFHRVSGVVIHLSPLAARPEEILPLARLFAERGDVTLHPGAEVVLLHHEWPGNVRELKAAMERAAVLAGDGAVDGPLMAQAIDMGSAAAWNRDSASTEPDLERLRLSAVCEAHGWSAGPIAATLGIARATLFRRLKALGLSLRPPPEASVNEPR